VLWSYPQNHSKDLRIFEDCHWCPS
jgi:hypothetical protein